MLQVRFGRALVPCAYLTHPRRQHPVLIRTVPVVILKIGGSRNAVVDGISTGMVSYPYLHAPKVAQHRQGCISSQQQLAATRLAIVHAFDQVS